ncbi:glycosyltransferase involved in cell wall biosynthesis [Neobacillus niacini]|uniref:glycosyltransferase n=1 Tax=Neobacillus niacini TaxID=86668 RepID=UPI00285CD34A|nr:glycosyltransferase [Neobacillus niacini]MDR7078829.1 glycosyltransferase involved in cell wall biosynthesis [Neobacillus niacini]
MQKKIVYLMHVDWDWIKQRPHFLAEKLHEKYDINVFYALSRDRKVMTANPTSIKTSPIVTLPFKKISFIRNVNKLLQKIIYWFVLEQMKPDIVWITHPSLHDYLPRKKLSKFKVVYDCMDDVLGFSNTPQAKKALDESEKRLFEDSEVVFVSSEHLQNQIVNRGCRREKTCLVRNGYNGDIIQPIKVPENKKVFSLTYVGTISNWVNFDIILNSLDEFDNIEYHFYGPIECKVPNNSRIIFHGPVKHSEIYETIKDSDCLIMPFKINDLILSVDPVKLYEYVNFNKNIITVYYEEIERFGDYVHFYRDNNEYLEVLRDLIENNNLKYNEESRYEFLVNNTWDKRTEVIIDKLESI